MKPFQAGLICAVLCAPGFGHAVTTVGFDHARPQKPQTLEIGGGVGLGDDILTFQGHGRMGLLEELDATLRAAIVSLDVPGNDQTGFEVELGGRMRFLRLADTRAVDLAAAGAVSFLKTEDVFVLGLDPQLLVSRHFEIAAGREIFVAGAVGLALTFTDVDAGGSDSEAGLLGALSAGVDVLPGLCISAELRLRDEFERVGIGVSHSF